LATPSTYSRPVSRAAEMLRSYRSLAAPILAAMIVLPVLNAAPALASARCEQTYVFAPQVVVGSLPTLPTTQVCDVAAPSGRTFLTIGWGAGSTGVAQADLNSNGQLLFSVRCAVLNSIGDCKVVSNISSTSYYSPLAFDTFDPVLGANMQFQTDLTLPNNVSLSFTLRPESVGACPVPSTCASVVAGVGDFSVVAF
jgi:hypothetical protein